MSYVKTTWVTGDIVTAPKLNNLESGVEANDLNKLNKPNGNGTSGQLLVSNGDGSTSWTDTDTTLEESGKAADAKATGDAIGEIYEALETKAEKDGTYENLTSGNAEVLLSDVYTENSEPYLFRKTGGSDKVGSREYLDKIVGGSLVWNQLVPNGDFSDGITGWSASRGTITVSNNKLTWTKNSDGSAGSITHVTANYQSGHIYLLIATLTPSKAINSGFWFAGATSRTIQVPANARTTIGALRKATESNVSSYIVYADRNNAMDINDTAIIENCMAIDLTAEFGTTIADYVYSLEQATADAGIAWVKQYIDLDTYHSFDAGTLKHVEGLMSHDTVGFNQWDEEWEVGSISLTTGDNLSSSTIIRSTNYVKVIPTNAYYFKKATNTGSFYVIYYDANKTFISYETFGGSTPGRVLEMPSGTHYIRIRFGADYGIVYNHDVCINISSPRNGEYEPYVKHSYPLDSTVVLRGIPQLVDGHLKYDGDEYLPSEVLTSKCVEKDLGDYNWEKNESTVTPGTYVFRAIDTSLESPPSTDIERVTLICAKYRTVSSASMPDKSIAKGYGVSVYIYIKDSDYDNATVEEFKAAMTGVKIVAKRKTYVTEQAEPFRQLQICDTYGTEEFVTTSEVPVGTETKYPEDLKAKVEGLPWDLSMIAPIEDGTTASKAYTTGQYFLHNNVFCKALTNIASGATFTLNTNYSETTIAAELYTALH